MRLYCRNVKLHMRTNWRQEKRPLGEGGCGVVFGTPRTGEVAALGMQALRLRRASGRDLFRKTLKLKVSRGKSLEGTQSFRGCYKKPAAHLKNHKLVNVACALFIIVNKGCYNFPPLPMCKKHYKSHSLIFPSPYLLFLKNSSSFSLFWFGWSMESICLL